MRYCILLYFIVFSTCVFCAEIPKPKAKPGKILEFNSGLVVYNWIWKFADAAKAKPLLPGWGTVTYYSISKIENVKINTATNFDFVFRRKHQKYNYCIGLRMSNYPFKQSASVGIWKGDTLNSVGYAEINLIQKSFAPIIGFGTHFRIAKKWEYGASFNLTYNLFYCDKENLVLLYDSNANTRVHLKVNTDYGYNSFTLDAGEINIQNNVKYQLSDKWAASFSINLWFGNQYLNNKKGIYANRSNYRYVAFNLGINYSI